MARLILMKYAHIFLGIWGICVIALWLRQSMEMFWKVLATCIFVFYGWFFFREVSAGYSAFQSGWYSHVVEFIVEFVAMVFASLFFFWPIALFIIFYKADDIGAEKLLKFMCIFTLVVWVACVFYVFSDKGVENFLYNNLKKLFSDAR